MTAAHLLLLVGVGVAVYLLASLAQAITGFGSALVAVPLLAFAVHPVTAVVATTAVSLLLTGWGYRRERDHADGPALRTLTLTGALGIPVGLVLLVVLDARVLQLVIAAVVLALVGLLATGRRVGDGAGTLRVAGGMSGALLSSTGMNGPPLVLALADRPPRVARATLQGVFCAQDLLAVAGFVLVGRFSVDAAVLVAAGAVAVPAGWWLGDHVFHRVPPERFRWLVLGGLTASALATVVVAL